MSTVLVYIYTSWRLVNEGIHIIKLCYSEELLLVVVPHYSCYVAIMIMISFNNDE